MHPGWREHLHGYDAEGFDVIAAPQRYTYFDYSQYEHGQPLSIAGPLTLEQTTGLAGEMRLEGGQELLIGGQFQLWTEYVRGWERAEYQLWPRGSSIAQQLWAGDAADGVLEELELGRDLLVAGDQAPADHVAAPADVLG